MAVKKEETKPIEEISIDDGWLNFFKNWSSNFKKMRALIPLHYSIILVQKLDTLQFIESNWVTIKGYITKGSALSSLEKAFNDNSELCKSLKVISTYESFEEAFLGYMEEGDIPKTTTKKDSLMIQTLFRSISKIEGLESDLLRSGSKSKSSYAKGLGNGLEAFLTDTKPLDVYSKYERAYKPTTKPLIKSISEKTYNLLMEKSTQISSKKSS